MKELDILHLQRDILYQMPCDNSPRDNKLQKMYDCLERQLSKIKKIKKDNK